jgi:hypothetical protein
MQLRDGGAAVAFAEYEKRGLLNWESGSDSTHTKIVADYYQYLDANPGKSALIVAHTNADVRDLCAKVREIERVRGHITGDDVTVKAGHGKHEYDLSLAAGDQITFGVRDNNLGVINGTQGKVVAVENIGRGKSVDQRLTVLRDDGVQIQFRASEYKNENGRCALRSGYACTIYASQGLTVDGDVFMKQSTGLDRKHTYVGASRAKDNTRFYMNRDEWALAARSGKPERLYAAVVQNAAGVVEKEMALEYAERSRPGLLAAVSGGQCTLDQFNERMMPAPAAPVKPLSTTERWDAAQAAYDAAAKRLKVPMYKPALVKLFDEKFAEAHPEHGAALNQQKRFTAQLTKLRGYDHERFHPSGDASKAGPAGARNYLERAGELLMLNADTWRNADMCYALRSFNNDNAARIISAHSPAAAMAADPNQYASEIIIAAAAQREQEQILYKQQMAQQENRKLQQVDAEESVSHTSKKGRGRSR